VIPGICHLSSVVQQVTTWLKQSSRKIGDDSESHGRQEKDRKICPKSSTCGLIQYKG
jgi:hypothetical protein